MASKPLGQSREVLPESKILFVTQESFAEVMQECFRWGALRCVINNMPHTSCYQRWKRFVRAGSLLVVMVVLSFHPHHEKGRGEVCLASLVGRLPSDACGLQDSSRAV